MARLIPIILIVVLLFGLLYVAIWRTPETPSKEVLTRKQAEVIAAREVLKAEVDKYIVRDIWDEDESEATPFTLLEARDNLRQATEPDHLAVATRKLQIEWDSIKRKR